MSGQNSENESDAYGSYFDEGDYDDRSVSEGSERSESKSEEPTEPKGRGKKDKKSKDKKVKTYNYVNTGPVYLLNKELNEVLKTSRLQPPQDFKTNLIGESVTSYTPLEWFKVAGDVHTLQEGAWVDRINDEHDDKLPDEFREIFSNVVKITRISFEASVHFLITLYTWGFGDCLPSYLSTENCTNKYQIQKSSAVIASGIETLMSGVKEMSKTPRIKAVRDLIQDLILEQSSNILKHYPKAQTNVSHHRTILKILASLDAAITYSNQSRLRDKPTTLNEAFQAIYKSDLTTIESRLSDTYLCYERVRKRIGREWSSVHLDLFYSRVAVGDFMSELLGELITIEGEEQTLEVTKRVLASRFRVYLEES